MSNIYFNHQKMQHSQQQLLMEQQRQQLLRNQPQLSPDTTLFNCVDEGFPNVSDTNRCDRSNGLRLSRNDENYFMENCSMDGDAVNGHLSEYLSEEIDDLAYVDFDILDESSDTTDKYYQHEHSFTNNGISSINDLYPSNCSDRILKVPSARSTTVSGISSVPSSSPYSGDYSFEVKVEKQSKDSKAGLYTFSEADLKLYTRPFVVCPVVYRIRGRLPAGTLIRVLPVYTRPEHVKDSVRRCPNHQLSREPGEEVRESVEHLMLAENIEAIYETDVKSGRLSITVDHFASKRASTGSEWYSCPLRFMCYSSCVGGLNRRPVQLIFTLEQDGQVLGRQAIEVRICACPGRDRRGAERGRLAHTAPITNKTVKLSQRRDSGLSGTGSIPGGKKIKQERFEIEDEDVRQEEQVPGKDNVFILSVRGRKSFELLVRLRDCLELVQFLPRHQFQYYSTVQQRSHVKDQDL